MMGHRPVDARWLRAAPFVPHVVLGALIIGVVASLVMPVALVGATAGVMLGGVVAALGLQRRAAAMVFGGLIAMAVSAGWGWGTTRVEVTRPVTVAPAGAQVTGTFDVISTVTRTERGISVRMAAVDVRGVRGTTRTGWRVIAELDERHVATTGLGRRVRVSGRFGPVATAESPGWWRAYTERQRLSGRMSVRSVFPAGSQSGWAGVRNRVRAAAMRHAGAGADGARAAVVRSMALGDASGLDERHVEELRDAGVWHLMVVSGQNVAMIALATLTFLEALGIRRTWATVVAIVLIVVYCLVCDGGPSVTRAGTMGVVGLLAHLRSTGRDRWYVLLVGMAVILVVQPRALTDPGFQLSFAAVVGMLAIVPPLWRWSATFRRPMTIRAPVLGMAATLATAPVIIWHFGEWSLAGIAANLIVGPIAGSLVVVALVSIVMAPLSAPVAAAIGAVAGLGAGFILAVAAWFGGLPHATVNLPKWAAAVAVLVCVAAIASVRRLGSARGGPVSRVPPRHVVVGGVAIGLIAVVVAVPGPAAPMPWPAAPAVAVLDVGQGDAVLLRSPEGAAALIDTGPPGDPAPVVAALRRAGVRKLDLLAVTHDQTDHSGAVAAVFDAVTVDRFATPVPIPAAERIAAAHKVPVVRVVAGDVLRLGGWRLDVMWPKVGAPPPEDPNDASLIVAARATGLTALLTGDAEGPVLRRLRLEDIDVLKVSHHGSADPELAGVLRRLRPEVALVSAGRGNRFGHPAPETLAMFGAAGVRVGRTDRSGTITTVAGGTDGPVVLVERAPDQVLIPSGP